MAPADDLTLLIGGRAYAGWMKARLARGIDRFCADFDVEVSERWQGQNAPWQIQPFQACQIRIGSDTVLTGYVEAYKPRFDARMHRVRICGRSRTCDLVECTPDIPSGQYRGYTLEAICRGVCALFGISVVVNTDATMVVADATIERCETAYTFLERLGRLAGVLMTDDADGNLVLCGVGATRASGALVQGQNILRAEADLDVRRRFSDYIVKGQTGETAGSGAGGIYRDLAGPGPVIGPSATGPVNCGLRAVAHDGSVPRYRPHVTLAESQLGAAQMQQRANWQMHYAFGRATKARIEVAGWRQPDGTLWRENQIVPVTAPWLQVDQDLLVVGVDYRIDEHEGRVTTLSVGPVEGYTPDPGQVRIHKHKGKGAGFAVPADLARAS